MAILAQKATLMAHVTIVASTPFNFLFAFVWIRRFRLLLILLVVGILFASGLIDIDLPAWADVKEKVIIGSGTVVVLWVLGGLLTVVDHIRFDGWTDDGPDGAIHFAHSYCDAILKGNAATAAEMCAPSMAKDSTDFSIQLDAILKEIGDARVPVTAEDLGTVDHVLFRLLIPYLNQIKPAPSEFVAFVPVVPDSDVPVGSPISVIQLLIAAPFGKFEVAETSVASLIRPPILT